MSADEIGLKGGPLRIAAPAGARNLGPGFGQQRISDGDQNWIGSGEWLQAGRADASKPVRRIEAKFGEPAIRGRAVGKLRGGGGQQPGPGRAAQAEPGAPGEGWGALLDAGWGVGRDASLPEGVEVVEEGRVFFRTGGGAEGRRRAKRLFCSTIHSTVSRRANSMAWARAEGKWMYHCWLALRWMSWTLVGNPKAASSI